MFDFIFNAIDGLLLLNLIFALLLSVSGLLLKRMDAQANWVIAAGILQALSLIATFLYFQNTVFNQLSSLLNFGPLLLLNIVHFMAPLALLMLFRQQLTGNSQFRYTEWGYLAISCSITLFFMLRYTFSDFNFCTDAHHCTNSDVGYLCSLRAYCVTSILVGIASIFMLVPTILIAHLLINHYSAYRQQSRAFKLTVISVIVFWLWKVTSASAIALGFAYVERTVSLSFLLSLWVTCGLIGWVISAAIHPLVSSYDTQKQQERKEQAESIKKLEQFQTYMEEHQPQFTKNLTLTRLAQAVGLSRGDLSALINQHYGKNYADFINQLRIERVKTLLADGGNEQTMQEIYESVGFNSKTAFHNAFKKSTNCTPTDYKMQISGPNS